MKKLAAISIKDFFSFLTAKERERKREREIDRED